ncbi:MAG: CPBP family intramembrane metalloprotease [Clostridia bacterium]|nr:CPBP family intramembrane metalloprotease [Clostridia bacterium]
MQHYTTCDTGYALVFYGVLMVLYYLMGRIYAQSGLYLGVPVSIVLILIPLLICRRRLSAVGISCRNLVRSLIVSSLLGILLLLAVTIVPGIMRHARLLPAGQIAANMLYYFIIIGMSEEICFRGFIQPRLYPLLRREWLTIVSCGILFVFMHYPFQMAARNMTFAEYWPMFIANAPMQFIWHLAFSWLYRQYGNIFGSTVLHGCVDMSMGIFG